MALCESDSTVLAGPCQSEGRWVGPDGKVRCALHQTLTFGHGEKLIRVRDYEPPRRPEDEEEKPKPKPRNGRRKKPTKGASSG